MTELALYIDAANTHPLNSFVPFPRITIIGHQSPYSTLYSAVHVYTVYSAEKYGLIFLHSNGDNSWSESYLFRKASLPRNPTQIHIFGSFTHCKTATNQTEAMSKWRQYEFKKKFLQMRLIKATDAKKCYYHKQLT